MMGSLIVGIDPGRYGHGVVVLGPGGDALLQERVANEDAAIEELVDRVGASVGGPGRAFWVTEADGGDGFMLIGALLARDELVATLTPTEVAAPEGAPSGARDLIDAELCARIGREEQATPGMSHRTGPRFLTEVGTVGRFGSPDVLAAHAGLTPTLWQSGRSSGTHFLTRRCNLHLREACWSAALGSLKTPAWRRFYDRKRSEGKSHHRAVIALARTQLRCSGRCSGPAPCSAPKGHS
jgi:hypothetical protein